MEERQGQEDPRQYKALRRGWCLSHEAFRNELLAQRAERAEDRHHGAQRQESGEKEEEQWHFQQKEVGRLLSDTLRRRQSYNKWRLNPRPGRFVFRRLWRIEARGPVAFDH